MEKPEKCLVWYTCFSARTLLMTLRYTVARHLEYDVNLLIPFKYLPFGKLFPIELRTPYWHTCDKQVMSEIHVYIVVFVCLFKSMYYLIVYDLIVFIARHEFCTTLIVDHFKVADIQEHVLLLYMLTTLNSVMSSVQHQITLRSKIQQHLLRLHMLNHKTSL
jgi:hypothetical protein